MTEEQRKLAAIVFTDLAGYTALTQSDEGRALRLLEVHNSLIRSTLDGHRGKEGKTIGDAFLLEFDSALDATSCAIDIQQKLHEHNLVAAGPDQINVRIGIHVGDIIHRGSGVLGDTVNIASRIEVFADAGGICVTDPVFLQVRNKITHSLVKLSEQRLKNVDLPITLYKVILPWQATSVPLGEISDSKNRVAVLPFVNISPDPNDEYFADGMTEELITSLSGIKQLTVIARTSVMKYKAASKGASEIGRELNVGTLVEGSVRKALNRVRIAVQLIDARNEGHVWAKNYDRQLDDIFAIQSEIAQRVAQELKVQLLAQEKEGLERKPTASTEAYTQYLKGRHYLNERTKEGTGKAVKYFEDAVKLDPHFALAYSGLADCYLIFGDYGWLGSSEALPKGKSYALRAVEIDPMLAEAHASLGGVLQSLDWNFIESEKEFKRAIELKPSYALAYQWYALLLVFMERYEEAFNSTSRAKELDPLSCVIGMNQSLEMVNLGRTEQAINQLKEVIELNPEYAQAHLFLGLTYFFASRLEEAGREVETAVALSGGDPMVKTQLCFVYGRTGKKEEADKILEELQKIEKDAHVSDVWMAVAFLGVGRNDEAFERLESAFRERLGQLFYLMTFPWLQTFRTDPRWISIEDRMRRLTA